MRTFLKRSIIAASIGLVALVVIVISLVFANRPPPDAKEFGGIMAAEQDTNNRFWRDFQAAKSPAEKGQATAAKKGAIDELAERCLKLGEMHPNTAGEIAALAWAASRAPNSSAGHKAYEMLTLRIATANLEQLGRGIGYVQLHSNDAVRGIAPALLERVKQNPRHPQAARLLTCAAVISAGDPEEEEPSTEFVEAADLIAERYADSPDIVNFCQVLGSWVGSPRWARRFEEHLRTILKKNQNREIRLSASFALASVVQSCGKDRQLEADQLYQTFLDEFDGRKQYSYASIENTLRDHAKREIEEFKARGLGKPAPEIAGVDLEGRPMKLSEFRGKVVLLNFWATWCFPCMKLIPHERALAARLEGKPFAIVGVNGDTNDDAARKAVEKHKMTWRSFQNSIGGKAPISQDWGGLEGWPTLYLIDREGIIRQRWIGDPGRKELDHAIDQLVDGVAYTATTEDQDRTAVVPKGEAPRISVIGSGAAGASERQPTGFVERVHRDSNGEEAKYVVFIPRDYDGKQSYPAILFLHGAGNSGDDNRSQLIGALAQAIQNREASFEFVAVFPQSQGGSWLVESGDGKSAVAILDEVAKDYRVDTKRIYLTGLSMGGEGTWSLAAAYPNRWAAIVPMCGGGDTKTAPRLKDIPCWCFHGDADRTIRVELSREMIRAIQNAGGRPLYHEYPGVDHNCWDQTYANPDLYEWLLEQKRP